MDRPLKRLGKFGLTLLNRLRHLAAGKKPGSSILLPGQAKTSSIQMQTREGRDIENVQVFETTEWDDQSLTAFRRKYSLGVTFRTAAIPVFNCHGLTFASRRSRIIATGAIRQILSDDRYEQVDKNEVLPGDIIIYVSAADGDFEHSGVVVAPDPVLHVPKIWSKWGFGPEVVHPANQCPYDFSNALYFRIRT